MKYENFSAMFRSMVTDLMFLTDYRDNVVPLIPEIVRDDLIKVTRRFRDRDMHSIISDITTHDVAISEVIYDFTLIMNIVAKFSKPFEIVKNPLSAHIVWITERFIIQMESLGILLERSPSCAGAIYIDICQVLTLTFVEQPHDTLRDPIPLLENDKIAIREIGKELSRSIPEEYQELCEVIDEHFPSWGISTDFDEVGHWECMVVGVRELRSVIDKICSSLTRSVLLSPDSLFTAWLDTAYARMNMFDNIPSNDQKLLCQHYNELSRFMNPVVFHDCEDATIYVRGSQPPRMIHIDVNVVRPKEEEPKIGNAPSCECGKFYGMFCFRLICDSCQTKCDYPDPSIVRQDVPDHVNDITMHTAPSLEDVEQPTCEFCHQLISVPCLPECPYVQQSVEEKARMSNVGRYSQSTVSGDSTYTNLFEAFKVAFDTLLKSDTKTLIASRMMQEVDPGDVSVLSKLLISVFNGITETDEWEEAKQRWKEVTSFEDLKGITNLEMYLRKLVKDGDAKNLEIFYKCLLDVFVDLDLIMKRRIDSTSPPPRKITKPPFEIVLFDKFSLAFDAIMNPDTKQSIASRIPPTIDVLDFDQLVVVLRSVFVGIRESEEWHTTCFIGAVTAINALENYLEKTIIVGTFHKEGHPFHLAGLHRFYYSLLEIFTARHFFKADLDKNVSSNGCLDNFNTIIRFPRDIIYPEVEEKNRKMERYQRAMYDGLDGPATSSIRGMVKLILSKRQLIIKELTRVSKDNGIKEALGDICIFQSTIHELVKNNTLTFSAEDATSHNEFNGVVNEMMRELMVLEGSSGLKNMLMDVFSDIGRHDGFRIGLDKAKLEKTLDKVCDLYCTVFDVVRAR